MILNRELLQGDKIPETQIAADLHVSKTPVREAIRRLAWEGLIETNTNKSATVTVLDNSIIKDLASVRWQHEKLNIPLIIYNGSNKDFDDLELLAKKCLQYNNKGDMNNRHKYDAKFHLKMYEIGGNKILYKLHSHLELTIQLWQVSHILEPNQLKEGLEQHFEIIDALRRHDENAALHLVYTSCIESYGIKIIEK